MKKNKMSKPLAIILITLVLIIGCISMSGLPSFILARYYHYIGHLKQNSKDTEAAIDDYTIALSYNSQQTNSYISRGSAYLDLKKYNEAIADYSEAIKLVPNAAESYAYRGRAYYELKDTLKSITDYNKALSLDNTFAYAYMNRGLLKYTLMNDDAGGCADLKKALQLGMTEAKELLKDGHCE